MKPSADDFDAFAESYEALLKDPIRDRFAASSRSFF